jgi:aryl-alcohol dehydrogenase-like predicted oxidoreductase
MIYQKFKNINFSRICFGCEPLGGFNWGDVDIHQIEKAINLSLDLGLNFFDTADVYGLGLSEERLSSILGSRRHDLIISTKGGVSWKKKGLEIETSRNSSKNYIRSAVEKSLKRLKIDILPVYFVHWPDNFSNIEETFSMLNELQDEEKIGLIGCSNFTPIDIKKALNVCDLSLIQLPMNSIIELPDQETLNICKEFKIKILAYNVLASGMLSGKFDYSAKFPETDRRHRLEDFSSTHFSKQLKKVEILKVKAKKKNLSLLDFSIQWALRHENVLSVITGIKNLDQANKNINAVI